MFVFEHTFDRHLQILREHFQPVDLADWVRKRENGDELPALSVAVTFDDGWQDNYEWAFPLLRQHDFPATIFLVTDMVGTERSFWPERLARAIKRRATQSVIAKDAWLSELLASSRWPGSDNPEAISAVIAAAKHYTDSEMNTFLDGCEALEGCATESIPRQVLNSNEVRAMAESGLITFGSHTRSHTRLLDTLTDELLNNAVVGSKQDLESLAGVEPTLFCYPNGDMTDRAVSLVRNHYQAAVSTRVGWNDAGSDSHRLNRITIHEGRTASRAGLIARLASD